MPKLSICRISGPIAPRVVASVLLLLALGPGIWPLAQFETQAQAQSGGGGGARTQGVEAPQLLFEDPFEIKSLGMRIFLPEDSLVDLSHLQGGKTRVKIIPQGGSRDWVIQVWNFLTKDDELSLEEAVENLAQQKLKSRVGQFQNGDVRSMFRMFDRERDLLIGAEPAQRVYFDVPNDPKAFAMAYTAFRLAPGNFVVFQLDCAQASLPRNREMFELLVASAEFRDPEEMSESRAAALIAGEAAINRFTNDEYESILSPEPRFFRIFRPAQTGDPKDATEIGYQRITMRRGQGGEVDGKPQARWRAGDHLEGFIVVVEARTLMDDAVADTIATFFLSDDREQELWSNDMIVRKSGGAERWTESGIRSGQKLVVKTVAQGSEPTETRWESLPASYISRAETYLLPRLVVRHELEGEFAYYAFDSFLGKLSIRRDAFERQAPNAWTLVTRASENSPPAGTVMDDTGVIIQRDLPRGEVVQPIDGRELRRLWQLKGLPLN